MYKVNVCDYEGVLAHCLKKSPVLCVITTLRIVTTTPFVDLFCHRTPSTKTGRLVCCMTHRLI